MKQREKLMQLLELMQANPELPVIPCVDGDVVGGDEYYCWLGSWGESAVQEFIIGKERTYYREEDICEMNDVLYERYDPELVDNMTDEETRAAYNALPWKKAIFVNVHQYEEEPNAEIRCVPRGQDRELHLLFRRRSHGRRPKRGRVLRTRGRAREAPRVRRNRGRRRYAGDFSPFAAPWCGKIQRAFPKAYVTMNFELILVPRTNTYINLNHCSTPDEFKAEVIEGVSRFAFKAFTKPLCKEHLDGINKLLDTKFTPEDMEYIYTNLGNGINHELCMKFVKSGYDLKVIEESV